MDKLNRFWLVTTGIIILLIIASSITIWLRHDKGQLVEISSPQTPLFQGQINIAGAVTNPGIYPVKSDDSFIRILQSSGLDQNHAAVNQMLLYIPRNGETSAPQKIDLNRAEPWLLQALPNIGEVRAQAIYDYRLQNGPFHNIQEITKVPGISSSIFEKIKDLITVADYH